MSAPRDTPDTSENLLLRAREGKLSDAQRRDLERALEMSETLRVAYLVGRDFDRLCAVQAGDDERIARAAGRALGVRLAGRGWAARTSGPGGRARRLAISLGIAAVLVVSSTAAWTGIVRPILRWRGAVAGAPDHPQNHEVPTGRTRGGLANRIHVDSAPTPRASSSDELALGDGPSAQVPSDDRQPQGAPGVTGRAGHTANASATRLSTVGDSTAAEVFRRANIARRVGDLKGANASYEDLQTRFPDSDEARLSFVSNGKLLLEAGQASEAERQLSGYLALGGGELTEEALVARAQCLALLGRNGDERQDWQRVLRDFPASVYGERARRRLGELAATPP